MLLEYPEFADVFSPESAVELLKHTTINNYALVLVKGQQLFYRPIYSLGPGELKLLKIYIKTHLAKGFICPSKSPAGAPILFVQKLDGSF